MSPVQAFEAALTGYAAVLAGYEVGLYRSRAMLNQFFGAAFFAIPVTLGAAIAMIIIDAAGRHFMEYLPLWLLVPVLMVYFALAGLLWARYLMRGSAGIGLKRGAMISDGITRRRRSAGAKGLTLAGHPIPLSDETKHFKLIGTTGTGKSTAIRELLSGALERGDRAVIADPDGSYLKAFYDLKRADVILNPFDQRSVRWDLFSEVQLAHDADQLARSLIPDHDGQDAQWRGYARIFLTAVLRQFNRIGEHDVGKLYRLLMTAPAEDLRDLLQDTPAAPYLGQDIGKFFESVRSVAITHIAALEHVARQTSGDSFGIRKWIRESRGGVLFLPYKAGEIAALRHIISTWMRIAIFETMNAEEGDQRLWFVIDELDALGQIDGLKDALARLRKFGGRCVLGFQSIAQIRGINGDANAQTIVENCGTTLILRCSASEHGGTARFASQLIGEREVVHMQTSRARVPNQWLSTVTTSEHRAIESAVMPSEIEQLPDLVGYLKFASAAAWQVVRIQRP